MEPKFDRVGIRDFKVTNIESHKITDLNKTFCPSCSAGPMDGVSGANVEDVNPYAPDAPTKHSAESRRVFPQDGSPTICVYCAELLVFKKVDKLFTLAYPTESQLTLFKSDAQAWRLISKIQEGLKSDAQEGRLRGDKRYAKSKPKRF